MNQDGIDKMGTEWMGLKQLTHYANLSERTLRAWIMLPWTHYPRCGSLGRF